MKSFFANNISISLLGAIASSSFIQAQKAPNVIFVLADEWRGQDVGYSENRDVITPNLDKLAKESINLFNTISCCPVSCPYRPVSSHHRGFCE